MNTLLFCSNSIHKFIQYVSIASRIPVHRVVLYTVNNYFKDLFTTELKEKSQEEISIKNVDGDVLHQLVEYCYIGEIAIDSMNVDELIKAANMLQFDEVKENCAEYYSTMLTPSNCLGIWEFADLRRMVQLEETSRAFASQHFVEVSQNDEFLLLEVDQLSTLLKEDQLNISSEEEVFSAAMRWVHYDIDGRNESLVKLLEYVRLKIISDSVRIQIDLICANC